MGFSQEVSQSYRLLKKITFWKHNMWFNVVVQLCCSAFSSDCLAFNLFAVGSLISKFLSNVPFLFHILFFISSSGSQSKANSS